MDWVQISKLAALLREKSDEVFSEKCKFTLSTKLLIDLNGAINLFPMQRESMSSSFSVFNSSTNVNVEIFRDIQFLHDFVQITGSLKLVQNYFVPSPNNLLEIDKFQNLKLLELCKVRCCNVQGIRSLRGQLQYLSCIRSISELNEILEKCGADNAPGHVWNDLKEIVFSHNSLESLDTSFEFTPWLHTLDLSHNELQDIRPLNCLYNLKNLNLGYNKLTTIPTFNGQICSRLQVLILCNNFIEDVTGLIVLIHIRELDLSENCILQHDMLTPLANLAALQWLNLEGNPISYHKEHRTLTAHNLHKNTGTVRFMLDRQVMNKKEIKHVGSLHPLRAKMPALSGSCSSSSVNTTLVERSRRTRHATISDENEKTDLDETFASVPSLVSSNDHLETRRRIEELIEKYGSTWLYKEGGSMVQDILGIPKSSYPKTSSPYEQDFLIHAREVLEAREAEHQERLSSGRTPPKNSHMPAVKINGTDDSKLEEKVTASNISTSVDLLDETSGPTTTYESATDQLTDGDEDGLYPDENVSISSTESMFDLGQGDDCIFIVTIKDQTFPIFFIIAEKFMAERDAIVNAKEKTKWDLNSLISCELKDGEPPFVQLEFDTLRSDRKMRQYVLDDEDETQRLIEKLSHIVANRPPEKLTCFKCMKCNAVFGIKKSKRMHDTKKIECPTCLSSFVIEED